MSTKLEYVNLCLSDIDYLMQEELALYPEDVLERRTKLYLFLDYDKIESLDNYMQKKKEG